MGVRLLAVILVLGFCALPVTEVRAQDYGYGNTVECRSQGYNFQRCPVPWPDAQLIRQLSGSQCFRGRNWGVDRGGLWVDRGCSGVFAPVGYGPGGWYPPPSWNQRFSVGCSSDNYQYRFCGVDLGGGGRAYLDRQTSGAACILGQTWGWNRAGIWVNQGCAGVFTIDRRWR